MYIRLLPGQSGAEIKYTMHKDTKIPKIQQAKTLVTCQRFGELFLFGLVWQYSSIQKNIIKVGSKSWILTCSCHIILSLPFYTYPASKRELNFCNRYLSLLYFCSYVTGNLKQAFYEIQAYLCYLTNTLQSNTSGLLSLDCEVLI